MVFRSLRNRLVRFLFGPPKAIEHKIQSEKLAEVCTRQSIGVENCRCFNCHCARTEKGTQRKIRKERARRAAVNNSEPNSPLQKPPQRPVEPNDPLYPPCQLDENDMCYWYHAREDYHVLPLLRELFGPNRPFWLKVCRFAYTAMNRRQYAYNALL